MTCYNNTVKQMKIKYFCGVILTIIFVAALFLSGGGDIKTLFLLCSFCMVIYPIEFLGFVLNFIPIIKGLIYPIPIVSCFVELFKSLIMGFKAFVWLIRNWKEG